MGRESQNSGYIASARAAGAALAKTFRLSLRPPRNPSLGGNWLGVGIGSSIDFQDHRPYSPGDDPRYINWQAYARTGSYTMKLYRDETSPVVDLALDVSRSMVEEPPKALAALSLFYLCIEQCLAVGAALRCWRVSPNGASILNVEELRGDGWLDVDEEAGCQRLSPSLGDVTLRSHSTRILISDFLYPGNPGALVGEFFRGAGWGVALTVYSDDEASPDWQGGMKLRESETGEERIVYCDRRLLDDYREAYRQHFLLWESELRRIGVAHARIRADDELKAQLSSVGMASGVFAV